MSTLVFKSGLWVPPDTIVDPFERPKQDYRLPVVVLNELGLTPEEGEILMAMQEYEPDTDLRPGDLVYLKRCPPSLYMKRSMVPRFWKIRWVVSRFQYEAHALAHDPTLGGRISGIDHIIALMESQPGYSEASNNRALVYAHAFPHGNYPDTALWFTEACFRKVTLHERCQLWPHVLEEAKAPFFGINTDGLVANFSFDFAPDYYSDGEGVGAPFESEEATFHTAALLGMEELMMQPVDPWSVGDPFDLDPEHDVFVNQED